LADPESDVFVPVPLPAFDYNFRAILQDTKEAIGWAARATALPHAAVRFSHGRGGGAAVETASCEPWPGLRRRRLGGHDGARAVRIAPDGKTTVVDLGADARGRSLGGAAGGGWQRLDRTRGSLWVWRGGLLEEFPRFQRVRALFQDRTGAIWIGADLGGGVVRYQNGAFTALDGTIPTPATAGGARASTRSPMSSRRTPRAQFTPGCFAAASSG